MPEVRQMLRRNEYVPRSQDLATSTRAEKQKKTFCAFKMNIRGLMPKKMHHNIKAEHSSISEEEDLDHETSDDFDTKS